MKTTTRAGSVRDGARPMPIVVVSWSATNENFTVSHHQDVPASLTRKWTTVYCLVMELVTILQIERKIHK